MDDGIQGSWDTILENTKLDSTFTEFFSKLQKNNHW